MAIETTLYESIGGAAAVAAAVDELCRRALGDAALAPYYAGTNMVELKKHQRAFITMALNGPGLYGGMPMQQAHAGRQISDTDFDRMAGHLADTLTTLGVPEPQAGQVMSRIAPLREDIVSEPARQ
ncbi:MAG: group I truncated hemoglobin [Dehalococcoidia bacterium]